MSLVREKLYLLAGNPEMEPECAFLGAHPRGRTHAWWPAPVVSGITPVIHQIEDDPAIREANRHVFESAGWDVRDYRSAEQFLNGPRPTREACLVIDINLSGMNGLDLLEVLRLENSRVPAIVLTGRCDAASAVAALKSGAADYIEKPLDRAKILDSIGCAMDSARAMHARDDLLAQAKARFSKLTMRERDVMLLILDGMPNKNIAADLNLSQRTVESHRANVMRKTGARSLPELVLFYLEAVRVTDTPRRHEPSGTVLDWNSVRAAS